MKECVCERERERESVWSKHKADNTYFYMGASEVFKFEIILFYRTVFNFDVMQVNWPNYIDKYVQVKPGLKPVFQALKSQFKAETI